MVRKLVDAGFVAETAQATDGRAKALSLTVSGRAVTAGIHEFARKQVAAALDGMPPEQQGVVVEGLRLDADALAGGKGTPAQMPVAIGTGYEVNLFARCIEMHIGFYALRHGFGRAFEARIAAGLGEFAGRMDRPVNAIWHAARAGQDHRHRRRRRRGVWAMGSRTCAGSSSTTVFAALASAGGCSPRPSPIATGTSSARHIFGPFAGSTPRAGSTRRTASSSPRNDTERRGAAK